MVRSPELMRTMDCAKLLRGSREVLVICVLPLLICSSVVGADVTLVNSGAIWRYNAAGNDLGTAWRAPAYTDTSWPSGPSQLGYGDGDETTLLSGSPVLPCYYFRHTFNINDPRVIGSLTVQVLRDDGCVIYLNGQEVGRYNMPAGAIAYGQWATGSGEYGWDPAIAIPNFLVTGKNVIAVEVHQSGVGSTDVSFDLKLTAKTQIPIVLNEPAAGVENVAIPAPLSATAISAQGTVDLTFYGRQTPPVAPDFSIVVLPDTQTYTAPANGGTAAMFTSQTDWIVSAPSIAKIAYVTHLGDVSENGDVDIDESEWRNATNALYRLEPNASFPGVPCGITVGNHDQKVPSGDGEPTTLFNKYFGLSLLKAKSYFGASYDSVKANTHYQLFSASGLDFVVILLEYGNTAALTWADQVLQSYPQRKGIVVSHYLIETTGAWGSYGSVVYETLKGNPNLFLMLCGHNPGEAKRSDTYNGNTVHTLLADFQSRPNGGNGYLRILTFSPANNEVRVQTYSPYLKQFESDGDSQFALNIPLSSSAPFALVQQNSAVSSGTPSTATWGNLAPGTSYDWYVSASDGTETATSEIRRFQTFAGVPAAPANLAAQPAEGQITLTWNASPGATSYILKRASTKGGPYAIIATGIVSTTFTESGLQNQIPYFYVVSASNQAGESVNSNEATATPRTFTAPVAEADAYMLNEDALLTIAAPGVLANDSDADRDPISALLVSGPEHGALTLYPDGSFTYTPAANFFGADSFTYRLSDGAMMSPPVVVSLTISPWNDPPVGRPDTSTTQEAHAISIDVLANDTDADPGDVLSVFEVGPAIYGRLSVAGSSVWYTPQVGFVGTDIFSYTVADSQGATATALVTVTVEESILPAMAPDGLSATPISNTEVLLKWTDRSSDEEKFLLEGSTDQIIWNEVAALPANATSFIHTPLISGNVYYYRVWALKGTVRSTAPSNIAAAAPLLYAYAQSETLVSGSLSASFQNTFDADSANEVLTEKLIGSKSSKTSALEHRWTFTVTPGRSHDFAVRAVQSATSDNESFRFAWSTDNLNYSDMLSMSASTDGSGYRYGTLPSALQGTVYVRLTDTDRTIGKTGLDSLSVDHLLISTDVTPVTSPPAAPVLHTALAGDTTVALNWEASDGATDYQIFRSTTKGGPYGTVGIGTTGTSFTDTTVFNGTTYYYVVEASNSIGQSAASNEQFATPQAAVVPQAPSNLNATGGRRKVTLTWTQPPTSGVTQNAIYRSIDGNTFQRITTIPAAITYTDNVPAGTYYYSVTAISSAGESGRSNVSSATATR